MVGWKHKAPTRKVKWKRPRKWGRPFTDRSWWVFSLFLWSYSLVLCPPWQLFDRKPQVFSWNQQKPEHYMRKALWPKWPLHHFRTILGLITRAEFHWTFSCPASLMWEMAAGRLSLDDFTIYSFKLNVQALWIAGFIILLGWTSRARNTLQLSITDLAGKAISMSFMGKKCVPWSWLGILLLAIINS